MAVRDAPRPQQGAIEFDDNKRLALLVGAHDRNLARIEQRLDVRIARRGNRLTVTGAHEDTALALTALGRLYERVAQDEALALPDIDAALRSARDGDVPGSGAIIRTPRRTVIARSGAQAAYMAALQRDDLAVGLGPAGTGKTFLAVAAATAALASGEIDRIVLSRPAVEAGERLGFLPGDLKDKVDPYLRPLYDALHDCLSGKELERRMASGDIEIAPLAFMRGRTLSHCFAILDEAQNATAMQMRMFLTRLGPGSRMAVTGDPSQNDLPKGVVSGLDEASAILDGVEGVSLVRFSDADVVRHPLVARIVRAYAAHDARKTP